MTRFDNRLGKPAAALFALGVGLVAVAGCGDPEAAAKELEDAKAKGTLGLMEYINAAPTISDIKERCLAAKDHIMPAREKEFEVASKADDPDSAIGAWAKENIEVQKTLGKCPREMDVIRDKLPKMEEEATAALDEAKLKEEMATLTSDFEAAASDRAKALELLAAIAADKRKMEMRTAEGSLRGQLLKKYVAAHPTGKLKMGMSGDDVKKALGGEPATTKPVEGTRGPEGEDVETLEWTFPAAGVELAVIQGGQLKRLVVLAPYAEMLYGVKVGDDLAAIHAALAQREETLDAEKIRLESEVHELVELFAWPADGKVAKVSVAGKGFIPYGPPPAPPSE